MYHIFTVKNSSDWQLPQKSCLINFSLLKEIYSPAPFRSFSIKYVCEGSEKYIVNGNKYHIEGGQYLLANHFAEGFVEIDKPVKGICIDVAPDMLSEVVASYCRPDTAFSDLSLDVFFNTADFLENKYHAEQTQVGQFLRQMQFTLPENSLCQYTFSKHFYFTLAEKIVADHIPVYQQLQAIKSLKTATKKDLFRRVSLGKTYIDAYFQLPLAVEEVAKICNLSEYHFFRVFRAAFGMSPYQYLLSKRLEYSQKLIKQGQTAISDIALEVGFADIYAFSKSFKQYFGIAPTKFRNLH